MIGVGWAGSLLAIRELMGCQLVSGGCVGVACDAAHHWWFLRQRAGGARSCRALYQFRSMNSVVDNKGVMAFVSCFVHLGKEFLPLLNHLSRIVLINEEIFVMDMAGSR